MPIYEYRCSLCGQEHEALQKVSEPPLVECPLKGGGWYATDFKGAAKKKPEEKKTESKTESKTETKTDTKPKSEAAT